MTIRAVIIGLALGLFIAAATYFNDQVIRQTYLIGNHLPASVFGFGLILLLLINPMWRWFGRMPARLGGGEASTRSRGLRPGEVAVIIAMGLAVCGWPGSNLLRYFTGVMALPTTMLPTKPAWQATHVMSYVPGVSSQLAPGFVTDWPVLIRDLQKALAGRGRPEVRRFTRHFNHAQRLLLRGLDPTRKPVLSDRRAIVRALNDAMEQVAAAQPALNPTHPRGATNMQKLGHEDLAPATGRLQDARALLDAAFAGIIRKPPKGSGVLLNNGHPDPLAISTLRSGGAATTMTPADLPWKTWWPTLRLWGGAAVLLGLATLCMIVVVHPQWSGRELLPYPTVVFVEEVTRHEQGGLLPDIARSRLFWTGFAIVFAWHTLNGLHAWFPAAPHIIRTFDFTELKTLFPNAARVDGSTGMLRPTIYFSVIGFGFFIPTRVSLSLGLSLVFWLILGSWMLAAGVPLSNDRFTVGANGTAMRFGSYIGLTLMIFYFGRRYYLGVLSRATGLHALGRRIRATYVSLKPDLSHEEPATKVPIQNAEAPDPDHRSRTRSDPAWRNREIPGSAVWAARLGTLCAAGTVYVLMRYAGLDLLMGAILVAMLLMIFLVLARLNVETGLFYAQPDFLPSIMLAGLFGVQGVGPEAMIVLSLASIVLVADPRETLSPYLANGLRMSQRVAGVRPGRGAGLLAVMIVLGLIVAVVVTLTLQYNLGLNLLDTWSNRFLPSAPFKHLASILSDLSSRGELSEATGLTSLGHLSSAGPAPGMIPWTLAGVALVIGCAAARMRLPWWPIHPILFIVWGTYPAWNFAFSFLLATVIKWAVVRVAGARGYHNVKPLMVGLIAAELLAVVEWSLVGSIYYALTGLAPLTYRIFPG